MITVLFQGDSLTDGLRSREDLTDLGQWYAKRVAGDLELKYPGKYTFINRGVAGNRVVDVYARMKADIINLKPDIMTISIGGNDVAAEYVRQNGVPVEKYERIYNMLLDEVQAALPNIKFIFMGSYNRASASEKAIKLQPELAERAAIAKKIAEQRGCPYIDLQTIFNEAEARGVTHLTYDDVHPDYAGSELIKNALMAEIEKL